MLDERPTTAELVAAVADFLEHDIETADTYRIRVAIHALGIVERELALGPGVPPVDDGDLASLRRNVMARLAIDNPRYPSLDEARRRWRR